MMTCRELVMFILDYLSDEMPAEARAEFEKHLSKCPPCREFLDSYKKTIELEAELARAPEEIATAMPEELIEAILASRPGAAADPD